MNLLSIRDYMLRDERPMGSVPGLVLLILPLMLLAQIGWHLLQPRAVAEAQALPAPPPEPVARLSGLDDPLLMSRLTMLWLQSFDNQPGVSIPFASLDYDRVIAWLDLALTLDPRTQYPLLTAARVYTLVPDPERKRKMLAFVLRKFYGDPDRRWVWLAHAVYVAQQQLHDLDTARMFAEELRLHATADSVPYWARHMEVYILEDMGELEAARVLIGALLESGSIRDEHEMKFLEERLRSLEQ